MHMHKYKQTQYCTCKQYTETHPNGVIPHLKTSKHQIMMTEYPYHRETRQHKTEILTKHKLNNHY